MIRTKDINFKTKKMAFPKNLADMIGASRGTFHVTTTNEKVADSLAYYFPEDTVLARLEMNGVTTDDRRDMFIDSVGGTIKAGSLMVADLEQEHYFSAITLTSGSCVAILK